MDTKYPANSPHNDRSFRGTFSIRVNTALQCVSLGNVGPACIENREKTCPGNPARATGRETNLSNVEFLFFFLQMSSQVPTWLVWTAGYVRAHTAL